ncbi:MAG TPA: ATP-grasp domain-containing protein [Aquifex aeolicus]|uniref:ATP-grasp domain-containing protein n=1 Tax=Aquifex aeolicus TaxID=63363 RepID=A0A7C5PZG6_AQUAO|nr:ATP-grasp domain-containing protein [Aquifex aeolicus]
MKIAVVYNEDLTRVLFRRKAPTRERYSRDVIERIVRALEEGGHRVTVLDGNVDFFSGLIEFVKEGGRFVFNLAYGIQGESRYAHIPAVLELLGVPYTGSGPLGHSLALDKVVTKMIFRETGVPTPDFRVLSSPQEIGGDLSFPLVVKPRMEALSLGLRLVHNEEELADAVRSVVEEFEQEALVEEFVGGREISVSLLGNGEELRAFPPSEIDYGDRRFAIQTHEDKLLNPPRKVCPAPLPEELREELVELSKRAFRAMHLRDYARFDVRLDPEGRPYFLEVNSMASLKPSGSFMCAACSAGYTYEEVIREILRTALRRYGMDA